MPGTVRFFAVMFSPGAAVTPIFATAPVQIAVGELVAVGPTQPVARLAKSIKRDQKSVQFRVTWSDFSSMSNCKATVLYDRKKRTLKHFASSSHRISDEPEMYLSEIKCRIYHGVDDRIIGRLNQKIAGVTAYEDDDAFFSLLKTFGCRKQHIFYAARRYGP